MSATEQFQPTPGEHFVEKERELLIVQQHSDTIGTRWLTRRYERRLRAPCSVLRAPCSVLLLWNALRTISVYPDDASLRPSTYFTTHSPSSSGDVNITFPQSNASNVIAAAEFAMWRRNGGVTGKDFRINLNGCGGNPGGGSCVSGYDMFIGNNGYNRKVLIVHELGHVLLKRAKGDPGSGSNGNLATDGECPGGSGHLMNSKEYLPAAIWEGFAHYYAAVVWNKDWEQNCRLGHYRWVDWDLDPLTPEEFTGDCSLPWDYHPDCHNYIDCEYGDHDDGVTVPAWDYYALHDPSCEATTDTYRGTTYDWLRFFWDLTTQQDAGVGGLSFTQVVELLVEAGVDHEWTSTSDADWTAEYCSGITYCDQHVPAWCQAYPSYRLTNAAFCLGHQDEWEYALRGPEANNVDR